jgi:hypothetical protein
MARLHVGLLSTAHSKQDILKALDKLPKGIDNTYDEIMNRIKSQPVKEAELAKRVLGWITYAKEPLTTKQLQQALSITLDSTPPDEDAETHEHILISSCLGIVTIDSKSNLIRLVHYTTQEYIERIRETQFPDAQTVIAKTCLTCLGFDVFARAADSELFKSDQFEFPLGPSLAPLDEYIFSRYPFRFWVEHINDMGKQRDVQEVALRFLTNKRKCDSIRRISGNPDGGILLHTIANYGLMPLFQIVLSGAYNSLSRYLSRPITVNICVVICQNSKS